MEIPRGHLLPRLPQGICRGDVDVDLRGFEAVAALIGQPNPAGSVADALYLAPGSIRPFTVPLPRGVWEHGGTRSRMAV